MNTTENTLTTVEFKIIEATKEHLPLAEKVVNMIVEASKIPGTGIAVRTIEYISKKISEGKAIIALHKGDNDMAGFCYIETWENKKYVANSGLIVSAKYRKSGLASEIKKRAFQLSRKRYPNSKIFGLTTSLAVMKINTALGYVPVTFSEITQDNEFWQGCESCNYYDILVRTKRDKCLCTGMLFDPEKHV